MRCGSFGALHSRNSHDFYVSKKEFNLIISVSRFPPAFTPLRKLALFRVKTVTLATLTLCSPLRCL